MHQMDSLQARGVRCLSADNRGATKRHRGVMRVVKRLDAGPAGRIPWGGRTLNTRARERIHVVHSPDWGGGGHERGRIGINVADYEDSPTWQSSMRVILAHEFAHSLIHVLVASAAGGNTKTDHLPA